MRIARMPVPALRPFVRVVWAADPSSVSGASPGARAREHVLPTGSMHLVFRLSGPPLRIYASHGDRDEGGHGSAFGHAVVGGARSTYYARDVSQPTRSVGAQLHPGAASLLLGVPASELAERHTRLDDLWGAISDDWRDWLLEARSLTAQLATFEALLLTRLPRARGVHPAVADALARLDAGADVGTTAGASGRSHRAFIALFREAVGLGPKRYARVIRFQRAIALVNSGTGPSSGSLASLVSVALDAGYADQAHLTREFRELAGLSPNGYRRIAPHQPNHVRVR